VDFFYLKSNFSSTLFKNTWWGIIRQDFNLKYEEVKIPVGFRYILYENKKIIPYINSGFSKSILLNEENDWRVEQDIDYKEDSNLLIMRSFKTNRPPMGYWGGLGLQVKVIHDIKGFFEIKFEQTTNIGGDGKFNSNLRGNINNFYTCMGLSF
jgi:hypothetical protein